MCIEFHLFVSIFLKKANVYECLDGAYVDVYEKTARQSVKESIMSKIYVVYETDDSVGKVIQKRESLAYIQ